MGDTRRKSRRRKPTKRALKLPLKRDTAKKPKSALRRQKRPDREPKRAKQVSFRARPLRYKGPPRTKSATRATRYTPIRLNLVRRASPRKAKVPKTPRAPRAPKR